MQHILEDETAGELVEFMANRMMIVLASPEEVIIKEGDSLESNYYIVIVIENDCMYFIASGSCVVE